MAGVVVVAFGGKVENGLIKTVDADFESSSIGSIRFCILACLSGLLSKLEMDVAFANGERKSIDVDCNKELDNSCPYFVEAMAEHAVDILAPNGDDGQFDGGD